MTHYQLAIGARMAGTAELQLPLQPLESVIWIDSTPNSLELRGTMLTAHKLAEIGVRIDRASEWFPSIDSAMNEFGINTPARQAAFIAQILHESGMLRYTVELWGPTAAQLRYEGRRDLGNTQPGDGPRFKGRGLLQTTGRSNYKMTGEALGVDLVNHPELLSTPEYAARSAGWYWKRNRLNALADSGDFRLLTRRINGGYNGYDERLALWNKAKEVLA